MNFEILGEIRDIETIAIGNSIRELKRLQKAYGSGRWRKLKGLTTIQLEDATPKFTGTKRMESAKKEIKLKYILE